MNFFLKLFILRILVKIFTFSITLSQQVTVLVSLYYSKTILGRDLLHKVFLRSLLSFYQVGHPTPPTSIFFSLPVDPSSSQTHTSISIALNPSLHCP